MTLIKLDWDTTFFGFDIGVVRKISFSKEDFVALKKISSSYKLVYICTLKPIEKHFLNDFFYEVDCKNTFSKDLSQDSYISINLDNSYSVFRGRSPSLEMVDLAIQSGEYSRFKCDSNFPKDGFKRLYSQWIINEVDNDNCDVIVHTLNGIIDGMITLSYFDHYAQVGLLAVSTETRGNGIGKR